MTDTWLIVILLALTTNALKVSGPILVGRRNLPSWTVPVIEVLPAAMLTALIVVQGFSKDGQIVVDERICGLVAAAAILIWRRQALMPAVVAAALVVAAIRAIF